MEEGVRSRAGLGRLPTPGGLTWPRQNLAEDDRERVLLRALLTSGPGYHLLVGLLSAVVVWGAIAYATQLSYGLQVTALRDYVSWGIYITNFVFFIGISHAGTLISAILRVTGAEWRRPITRMAEAITVFALMVGAPMVIIDLGRPDRLLNILRYGRVQSPLIWDVISISSYLAGSMLYLYLPLIPDLALLRDGALDLPGWRRRLYSLLSLGWRGSEEQRERLERAIGVMAVLIIPVAVSVHTVVSWIFGMTLRPGWHSTIFGPYFVVGAIFSGVAAIITAMAIFRRVFRLEGYLEPRHFRHLGLLLLTMDLIYIYFTLSEYLTSAYTRMTADAPVLAALFSGQYAPAFWGLVLGGMVLPALLLVIPESSAIQQLGRMPVLSPRPVALATAVTTLLMGIWYIRPSTPVAGLVSTGFLPFLRWATLALWTLLFLTILPQLRRHPIATVTVAAVLVNIAMWLKRYVIIVPTMANPWLPIQWTPTEWATYSPTWVEWSITAAGFAAFILLYILFARLFPIISIWETREAPQPASQP